MANIQSMKKDLRRNAKKRVVNQAFKSSLKTYLKKARGNEKNPSTPEAVVLAMKALDKAVQRGIIHKNQAARRKSRLALAVNKASATK